MERLRCTVASPVAYVAEAELAPFLVAGLVRSHEEVLPWKGKTRTEAQAA